MHDWYVAVRSNLCGTADIAGDDDVGTKALKMSGLAVAQTVSDFRLEQAVCAGRATAQVSLGRGSNLVSALLEQALGQVSELLPVLQ
jgi:hypothetical protein